MHIHLFPYIFGVIVRFVRTCSEFNELYTLTDKVTAKYIRVYKYYVIVRVQNRILQPEEAEREGA